jgi:DNA-binding NtrC family response regulator
MLRLVVSYADQLRYLPYPDCEVSLGASKESEIAMPYPGVSRRHAIVRPVDGGLLITDVGSKNGLLVRGRRVQEVLLHPGDEAQLGYARLALESVSTSEAELALALEETTGEPQARRPSGSTDELPSDSAVSSPVKALQLIRALEGLSGEALAQRRQQLFDQACAILGGEALIAFRAGSSDEEFTIRDLAGTLPDPISLLSLEYLGVGDSPTGAGQPAWLATTADGQGYRLAVLLSPSVARSASWRRPFLDYLGSKFLGDVPPAELDEEPNPMEDALSHPPGMVLGSSAAMQALLGHLRATVRSHLDVLLLGETGTGKELFARLIHASGPKPRGPFVAINCAAISADLLEAELFGVLGRVATGVDARPGLFAQADGGTIFLDEIGDMPERLQAKLLRVLQEREVLPVGGATARRIDVRVLSASNRDLAALARQGVFRADLYYRLRALEFRIPPLRERREDIPQLVLAFLQQAARRYDKPLRGVSRKALERLMAHDWPGNVRELEDEIERAVLLTPAGGTLHSDHLGLTVDAAPSSAASAAEAAPTSFSPTPLPARTASTLGDRVHAVERDAILDALRSTGGKKTLAARLLGLTRQGLAQKMKRLGMG